MAGRVLMYQLGLSAARQAAYDLALRSSHRIRVGVTVYGPNETPSGSLLVPNVLTGDVQVQVDGSVSRSLSLTMLDPNRKLMFDAANPASGSLYAEDFVGVTYGVEIDRRTADWVDVPVFFGPVTKFDRNGPEVSIEAQGKESLALDPYLVTAGYTVPKGHHIADAIRSVMNRIGENRYALDVLSGKLTNHRPVVRGESPWAVVCGGAFDSSGGGKPGLMARENNHYRLFYDGAGRLTAKARGGNPLFTFDGRYVLSEPGYSYDVSAARNRVDVTGPKPRHAKGHFHGSAVLPAAHPLSAQNLARNGKPRWMIEMVQVSNLKSNGACKAAAQKRLNQLAQQGLEASFDCLPVPHLEEADPVAVSVDGYTFGFALRTFTIPLTADSPMSVGGSIKTAVAKSTTRGGWR